MCYSCSYLWGSEVLSGQPHIYHSWSHPLSDIPATELWRFRHPNEILHGRSNNQWNFPDYLFYFYKINDCFLNVLNLSNDRSKPFVLHQECNIQYSLVFCDFAAYVCIMCPVCTVSRTQLSAQLWYQKYLYIFLIYLQSYEGEMMDVNGSIFTVLLKKQCHTTGNQSLFHLVLSNRGLIPAPIALHVFSPDSAHKTLQFEELHHIQVSRLVCLKVLVKEHEACNIHS